MRGKLVVAIAAWAIMLGGCERTVLDERFHDRRLAGWEVVDDSDTVEGPSKWQVEDDGWLHQKSNIWGRRGDFIGRWYGTCMLAGDPQWRDYTFSVKARPGDNDGFGVVFRAADKLHFYRLLFIQGDLNGGPITRLDKRDGADYTELWSAPQGYEPGVEMSIAVEVVGDKIRANRDRAFLLEVRDSSYPAGKVGLFCFAQSDQAFDDVKVKIN